MKKVEEALDGALSAANMEKSKLSGAGLAFPGPVDTEKKRIKRVVNLGWNEPHDVREIGSRLGVEGCWVDNDANMGCYGEWAAGAAKGTKACYGVFVGTGLGGGYIVNGELVQGPHHHCGEVGHTVIDLRKNKAQLCGCGKRGCAETVASKVR